MTRHTDREDHPSAGRDPANKKKFSLVGIDATTKEKRLVEVMAIEEPVIGSTVTGIDKATGKTVTIKVSGRDPANK